MRLLLSLLTSWKQLQDFCFQMNFFLFTEIKNSPSSLNLTVGNDKNMNYYISHLCFSWQNKKGNPALGKLLDKHTTFKTLYADL